jgi:hypothetical protein
MEGATNGQASGGSKWLHARQNEVQSDPKNAVIREGGRQLRSDRSAKRLNSKGKTNSSNFPGGSTACSH